MHGTDIHTHAQKINFKSRSTHKTYAKRTTIWLCNEKVY